MVNGGYTILDFENKSLSATSVTIKGLHAALSASKRVVLAANINIGGTTKHDAFVEIGTSSTSYTIHVYGGTITITNADAVTYAADI